MPDLLTPSRKQLGLQRSHEDSKAVNALFQAAGQSAILINGGASTAILAYSASEKASIRIASADLGWALSLFAIGVVSGAFVIALQAISAQMFVVKWEGEALEYDYDVIDRSAKRGMQWSLASRLSFVLSTMCFLAGAVILTKSLAAAR